MKYAHENIKKLMHEAVESYLAHRGLGDKKHSEIECDAIVDIVGYPYKGYDDKHFTVKTLIILDKEKTILKEEKLWLGWEIVAGYKVEEGGKKCVKTMGFNGQRVTSTETIGENELMLYYFETEGNPLYRIRSRDFIHKS